MIEKYICIKNASKGLNAVFTKGEMYDIDVTFLSTHIHYILIKNEKDTNTFSHTYLNSDDMKNFIKLEEYKKECRNEKINEILEDL